MKAVSIVILAYLFCIGSVQARYKKDNFHVVEANKCYRSAQLSPKVLQQYINKYHIKTVINLRGKYAGARWWQSEKNVLKKCDVTYVNIAMKSTGMPSKEHVKDILIAFKKYSQPLLLHCFSGINRTGLASAIWVLDQKGSNKEQAMEQLSKKYGYDEKLFPAKKRFIDLWQGRQWALTQYNP